jgi:formate hydrogenlyase subunit 3/multisubunit Na+/H+ antiporter MnhD subunit
MSELWLLPVLVPLCLAVLVVLPGRSGRVGLTLAPWAALPALLLAVVPDPGPPATLPWLLLGTTLGLDITGQLFLFLGGLLWLVAGLFGRTYLAGDERRTGFFAFFLLAMAGNLGLAIAQDVVSFYLFFALMTFTAYPLIVHPGHAEARRAGRIYLVMAVAGETMLLLALLLVTWSGGILDLDAVPAVVAASPVRDTIIALVLAGFGIKIGALPLHVWLPLAHPVAPTPASAVLSGAMIKAGLLGWIRFLPLGEVDLNAWGALLIVIGLVSAFFGVVIGVTQRDPKTALAYSSISQMGIINVALGAGLMEPRAWPAGLLAALIYALHHGLAKGSLFLGVGIAGSTVRGSRSRRLLLAAMALPALALAGAPLTSGAVAKLGLKEAAAMAPEPWRAALDVLLPIAAIGTTLLMIRVLRVLPAAHQGRGSHGGGSPTGDGVSRPPRGLVAPWAVLLAGVATASFVVPEYRDIHIAPDLLDRASLWTNAWPVGAGLALYTAAVLLVRLRRIDIRPIAPGDLLVPLERALSRREVEPVVEIPAPGHPVVTIASRWYGLLDEAARPGRLVGLERRLSEWTTAGLLFIAILLALLLVLVLT